MLRAAVCTQQIHIQRVFEHVLFQIFNVCEAPDTGSRNKNIDRAVGFCRKGNQMLDFFFVPYICLAENGIKSFFLQKPYGEIPFSRVELARTTFAPP